MTLESVAFDQRSRAPHILYPLTTPPPSVSSLSRAHASSSLPLLPLRLPPPLLLLLLRRRLKPFVLGQLPPLHSHLKEGRCWVGGSGANGSQGRPRQGQGRRR
jgi:hypothetical protein